MKLKALLIVVLILSAAALNLAFQGSAAAGEVRLQAILTTVAIPPSLPPPPPADALPAFASSLAAESIDRLFGRVKYFKSSNAKRTEEELLAKVTTSVPNFTLGISEDLDEAADNTGFLLRIFQGVGPIEKGSCVLLFKHLEFDYLDGSMVNQVNARFATDVKERVTMTGMQIRKRIGSCWVNGVEGSVPDIAAGDTAEIYLLTDLMLPLSDAPTQTGAVVMTGTFVHGHFHDGD